MDNLRSRGWPTTATGRGARNQIFKPRRIGCSMKNQAPRLTGTRNVVLDPSRLRLCAPTFHSRSFSERHLSWASSPRSTAVMRPMACSMPCARIDSNARGGPARRIARDEPAPSARTGMLVCLRDRGTSDGPWKGTLKSDRDIRKQGPKLVKRCFWPAGPRSARFESSFRAAPARVEGRTRRFSNRVRFTVRNSFRVPPVVDDAEGVALGRR